MILASSSARNIRKKERFRKKLSIDRTNLNSQYYHFTVHGLKWIVYGINFIQI